MFRIKFVEAFRRISIYYGEIKKTNYEELLENKMLDPEFRVQYLFAKEKFDLELMINSIKESIKLNKSTNTIMRRVNTPSKNIHNISL